MYLIGIDCGSTMVKAALFDETGKEYAVAGRKIDHIYKQPGWTENDMNALWESVCECLTEICSGTVLVPADIACITCTGHGNGLYLVDEHGEPVRNGIISSDNRARKYIDEWNAGSPSAADKILPKTLQSIWAAQPNALLRWLIDNEPETMRRVKHLFMVKDYIRFKLTGEAFMELSDMSATSLMNTATGEYDDDVLTAWELQGWKHILPPLKKSADICGTVRHFTPLNGVAVAGGNFDIDSCGLAVGMTDDKTFCMVAGTWGNNQFITSKPIVDKDVFMGSLYSIDGYWLVLEGSPTSASNLEWFAAQFFDRNYEAINQLVESADVFHDAGVTFIPYLYGGPVSPDAKSVLFGLDGRHTKADVMRAVYEGIVFGHRWHTERLLRFIDRPKTIRLTGGAVRSDVWIQMFADIFQIPVEIPAGTELGCFGAAIVGAVAAGIYPNYKTACEKMVKIERRFEPNPAVKDIYETKYRRFLKLLEIFKPHWNGV